MEIPKQFFSASDLRVQRVTIDDNGTKTTNVFSGIFCQISFEKSFKCRLDLNTKTDSRLKPLSLESTEFQKTFKSFTDNQIESRLILTVALMEKLLKLSKNSGGKMTISFQDKNLFMTFQKNLFKIPLAEDKFSFKTVEKVYDDLALIMEIVKIIQENKKIFNTIRN